jgi:hypothetical protein
MPYPFLVNTRNKCDTHKSCEEGSIALHSSQRPTLTVLYSWAHVAMCTVPLLS